MTGKDSDTGVSPLMLAARQPGGVGGKVAALAHSAKCGGWSRTSQRDEAN
jgi:hypothetical protein